MPSAPDPQTTTAALAAVVRDVQANVSNTDALRELTTKLRRDRVLGAISQAASQFLDTANWDDDAAAVLGRIGTAVDASRVYLFESLPDTGGGFGARMRHEWVADGIVACPDAMPRDVASSSETDRLSALLRRGDVIQGKLAALLPVDCSYFSRLTECSIAAVPIFAGAAWWGYLGFTDDTGNREWSMGLRAALKSTAAMLGAAIFRARAEEQLRSSEASYRQLSDAAFEGVLIHDQGIILDANPAIGRMFGYSLEEIRGRNVLDLMIAPESRDLVMARMRSPSEDNYEVIGQRRDGSLITADVTARPTTHHGMPARVVTILDITARRANEAMTHRLIEEQAARAAAEASRQRAVFLAEASRVLGNSLDYKTTLRSLASLAVPAIADFCIVDVIERDGAIERVAAAHVDAAQEPLLWKLTEWVRKGAPMVENLRRALVDGQSMIIPEVTEAILDSNAIDEEHGRLLHALAPRSLVSVPLNFGGKVVGALALYRTASGQSYGDADLLFAEELARRASYALENARLLHEAESATRAREHMLSIVAHDLRNPLGTILMVTDLIEETTATDSQERRLIAMVRRAGQRMNRLIQDLLDARKMENGKLTMDVRNVTVAALLSDAADTLRPLATGSALDLGIEALDDLPMVSADASRIQQVLSNLVGNAIKFTPRSGRITLRAEHAGADVRFAVVDTGPGIPAEQVPHVFGQYWQATSGDRRGIGLGLSIAKGIVEAHDGRIWVESTLGAGSAFFFTLPVAAAETVLS
ncbi:hypothetical protein BH09GEM1_BH09GEM1_00550 [soil metagenome]